MKKTHQPRNCDPRQNWKKQSRSLKGLWKNSYYLPSLQRAGAPVLKLRRAIIGISQKMLIQQLRDLEKHAWVARKVYPEVPPKVEYKLTKTGSLSVQL